MNTNILRVILLILAIATTMVGVSKINYKHNQSTDIIIKQIENNDNYDLNN